MPIELCWSFLELHFETWGKKALSWVNVNTSYWVGRRSAQRQLLSRPVIQFYSFCCCCWVASVGADSVRPHRRQPTRLRRPWDSPGKNTGVGCQFLLQCRKVKSEREVAQLCPTLSDPRDCSPPGPSVHRIFQARGLEWVPLPSPLLLGCCC